MPEHKHESEAQQTRSQSAAEALAFTTGGDTPGFMPPTFQFKANSSVIQEKLEEMETQEAPITNYLFASGAADLPNDSPQPNASADNNAVSQQKKTANTSSSGAVIQKQASTSDLFESGAHTKRNQHNRFPVGLLSPTDGASPDYTYSEEGSNCYQDEEGQIWELYPDNKNVFHQPDDWDSSTPAPNKKFLSKDGSGGSYEAILQPNGDGKYTNSWLNTGSKQGTYNFFHPEGLFGNIMHGLFDVLPHFANDAYDSTPTQKKEANNPPPFQYKEPSSSSSSKTALPEPFQAKMEHAFQTDFSDVNIHQDSQSATDVGALAYAQGSDVHFAPGQFKPDTQSGQELIGHELTHVVQQREGRVQATTQAKGMAVNDNPGLEREADEMGRKAAQFKVNTSAAPQHAATNNFSSHANTIQKKPESGVSKQGNKTTEGKSTEISNDFNTDPGWNDVGETGIVYQEEGANLRATPLPGQGLIRNLAQNEKVSILKHNPTTKWYAVITPQSEIGYIADHLIWKNLPDYNTKVLQVEGGKTALAIAFEHYGGDFNSWGEDARFVVNALVYANNSTPQNGTGNKGIFNNSDDWEHAKLTANAYIWLPSVEFIRTLKGKVGTGSITNDLWEGAKDVAKGYALAGAFTAGILHGAFDGLVTLVKDAIGGVWDIIKGIFMGTIIDDISKMIDAILNLTWKDLMEMLVGWTKPWIEKTKSDNVFVKGHAYGYITGRILFEILSMFVGGGAVLKIISKFGKLGKTIVGVVNKINDAVKNITGPAKQRLRQLVPNRRNRQNADGQQYADDLVRGADEPSLTPDVDVEDVASQHRRLPQNAANWSEVEGLIGRHIDNIVLPSGYSTYTRNGRTFIRRAEGDDSRFVRLTVDENGNVQIGAAGSNRISVNGRLRRALRTPAGHQAHHLVPDEIVRNHDLFRAARTRGRPPYEIDNVSNGISLPETDATRITGVSDELPLHKGSHPQYNQRATLEANGILDELLETHGTIDNIPANELTQAAQAVEDIMRDAILDWPGGNLN